MIEIHFIQLIVTAVVIFILGHQCGSSSEDKYYSKLLKSKDETILRLAKSARKKSEDKDDWWKCGGMPPWEQ